MIHFLLSDIGLWLMSFCLLGYAHHSYHHLPSRKKWQAVLASPIGRTSTMICLLFWLIALADSVHFDQPGLPSLLDHMMMHL